MNDLIFQGAVCTDRGNYRKKNEDNFSLGGRSLPGDALLGRYTSHTEAEGSILCGVFDGVGGEMNGEYASAMGATLLPRYEASIQKRGAHGIHSYISAANLDICDLINQCGHSMGTTAALLVASGASLLFPRGGRFNGYLLLPAYTWCLWLVLTYQAQAGNPVIQAYVYQILAVICSLLAFYFTAGFSFEKGKPFPTLCTGLLAVFFSGIALADFSSRMNCFLFSFSIVYFTAHSAALLRNLTAKRED